MLLDIPHQETQHEQGHDKGHHRPRHQQSKLQGSEGETELHHLQEAGPEHDRDGQEKGILRSHGPGHPDEQRPHNGGAGAGSAGEHGSNQLEHANQEGRLIGDLGQLPHSGPSSLVPGLHHDERHAEHDQRDGHAGGVVEQFVEHIVEQDADHRRRHAGHQYLEPQYPDILLKI